MAKIMGFANLHGNKNLGPLTENRPLGSTSFLGRYGLMDFTLSNFSNSGIDKVGILIEAQPRSIMKHLGSTNAFNTNTKLGFEQVLYNEKNANNPLYNHDLNNLKANDLLYTLDFRPIIKQHLESKEPITLVVTKVKNAKTQFLLADAVTLSQGRITNMIQNQGTKDDLDISLDTYVISKSFLNQLMDMGPKISATFGIKEILRYLLNHENQSFMFHRFTGNVRPFDSLDNYFENSMAFLDYGFRNKFFTDDWPIYTVSHNTAPARFGPASIVKNSMIANGAKIFGTVINSIISRNVIVEAGAIVKNSIVFTDSKIGKDVFIQRTILDKYVRVEKTKQLVGKETPLYIKQGENI
jgi:glucose-1-phosphate adenylyltransferase